MFAATVQSGPPPAGPVGRSPSEQASARRQANGERRAITLGLRLMGRSHLREGDASLGAVHPLIRDSVAGAQSSKPKNHFCRGRVVRRGGVSGGDSSGSPPLHSVTWGAFIPRASTPPHTSAPGPGVTSPYPAGSSASRRSRRRSARAAPSAGRPCAAFPAASPVGG